jgi:signal transduction histidine kinase
MEDAAGRVWVSAGEEICQTDARALESAGGVAWSCENAARSGEILSPIQGPSGDLWAGTLHEGVIHLRAGAGWEPIPGTRMLPGRAVRALRPSPAGGVWMVSYGTVLRVVERPGAPEGWEIVARPSPWHGLMISDAEDILEEPGGDLWITTLAGLVQVPAAIRSSVPSVPPVELVDVLVDGEGLPLDRPVRLPYQRNRIELRYAGLSYRDPGLLRYQVRLGPERPWIDASGRPSFRFVDLPPGAYHAEVRASLDGSRWSSATAGVSFTVLPPFWSTWWFGAFILAAVAAAVVAVFRYRLAQSLRLERTRTRIAADLHDDIGASLSRIALQSELVRRRESIRPGEGDRLLGEIGESARGLVDAMSDIVWSIDPRRDDLASVIARVRQFALDLLEPRGIALEFRTPDGAERVKLGPERRRHLYLVLKEAVNNVAKHAGCRRASIVVGVDGDRLRAEVRDDGRGFEAAAAEAVAPGLRGGHGLHSMRNRAREAGGSLEVRSTPGEGTVLTLTLPVRRGGA